MATIPLDNLYLIQVDTKHLATAVDMTQSFSSAMLLIFGAR